MQIEEKINREKARTFVVVLCFLVNAAVLRLLSLLLLAKNCILSRWLFPLAPLFVVVVFVVVVLVWL